jgi:hypothetical protein
MEMSRQAAILKTWNEMEDNTKINHMKILNSTGWECNGLADISISSSEAKVYKIRESTYFYLLNSIR